MGRESPRLPRRRRIEELRRWNGEKTGGGRWGRGARPRARLVAVCDCCLVSCVHTASCVCAFLSLSLSLTLASVSQQRPGESMGAKAAVKLDDVLAQKGRLRKVAAADKDDAHGEARPHAGLSRPHPTCTERSAMHLPTIRMQPHTLCAGTEIKSLIRHGLNHIRQRVADDTGSFSTCTADFTSEFSSDPK